MAQQDKTYLAIYGSGSLLQVGYHKSGQNIHKKHIITTTSNRNRNKNHRRIQRGGGGAGGPNPLKKSQKYRFCSNTGPDPLKITKLPSQHSMLGHHRHANETPFSKRRFASGPALSSMWIISPLFNYLQKKKKKTKKKT